MSKLGRKPIDISGAQVTVKDNQIHYKGAKASGMYSLSNRFNATITDNKLTLVPRADAIIGLKKGDVNQEWGMHRALLANEIVGAKNEFEKIIEIVGLGFKAVQSGSKLVFTLGYSHKIDFELPKGISIAIDKTGQKLTLKSADKGLLGLTCDQICSFRRPEPYKGTGIKVSTDVIFRKVGKTK